MRLWLDAPRIRRASSPIAISSGSLLIRAPSGHVFPLQSVAKINFVGGQPEITRDNLAQIVAVTAEIGGGHDLGSTARGGQKALATARPASRRRLLQHRRRLQAAAARGAAA